MSVETDVPARIRAIALPTRGGEMAGLEFGPQDRPVDVVFAHANGFNARTYSAVLAPLTDLRILAVDLRGYGLSDLPARTEDLMSWAGLADDHLALLAALDLTDVVLAGHSMGGAISLMAAAQAPGRVRALALFDPVVLSRAMVAESGQAPGDLAAGASRRRSTFPSRAAAFEAYKGRGAFRTWPDEMLADYVADGFRDLDDGSVELTCAPAWEAAAFKASGNDALAAFYASRCPIAVFRAEKASTAWIDDEIESLAATGRITVQSVPGTTHFLPMERPDVVQAALRAAAR